MFCKSNPMKNIFLTGLLLFLGIVCFAQPENIQRLMEKANSGQELTEAEMDALQKWMDSMEKKYGNDDKPVPEIPGSKGGSEGICPKAQTTKPNIVPLTLEGYVALAKSLMTTYGPRVGKALPELKKILESSKKPTDGSDMGALFMMEGAGSATIYSTAWSALKDPDDLLTANNLGVALKDMGEYVKALRVLMYADKLKPNIALVVTNLGWVYREMGDPVNAQVMFERAAVLAPEMPSPQLGLGLIYECKGNHALALKYLRKALAGCNSAVGIMAYQKAKEARTESQSQEQDKPLSSEKGQTGDFSMPDLPVSENKATMEQVGSSLIDYHDKLSSRTLELLEQYQSLLKVVSQQNMRAQQDPDNSIVFSRDFSKEIFMFYETAVLLLGENSNYGKALKAGTEAAGKTSDLIMKDVPLMTQLGERHNRLNIRLMELMKEEIACGDNDACIAEVTKRMVPVKAEISEVEYEICLLQKGELDINYTGLHKLYKGVSDAFKEAAYDFYTFTNPVLEKVYAPSLNELMNTYRELVILTHLQNVVGMGMELPGIAQQYDELKCVEPQPPDATSEIKDPEIPKKDKKPCPLGEKGIGGGVGVFSFELGCDHVKISGGEGLLWSIGRDFKKYETTFWGGVGVQGDYGHGNIDVEANIGVGVTIGQGDVVKDVALTSSVKAGLGGLVEGELSGRLAAQGGPSVEATGSTILDNLPPVGK
jgi:tetratricopeptide (TPR) repeat protein